MKQLFLFSCLALTVLCQAQDVRHFMVNGRRIDVRTFDRQVSQMMKDAGVPGMSLAVMDRGRVVYSRAYGYKDFGKKDPVNDETIFEACSLSKNFLAFAVYKLVDEGRLDLDKPLYKYLPYPPLAHDPRYKRITARMVLSHTSGLENWQSENNPDTLEILADPGTRFIYSGEGYQYLAKVVATILHKPYEEYIREIVFQPLGLKRTYCRFENNGTFPGNYAIGHDDFYKTFPKTKRPIGWPASGVSVTAYDYARMILALFDGKHITAGSIRELLTPCVRLDATGLHSYGPGFELLFQSGDTIVSQAGSNTGFKGKLLYSVSKRCGIVYFTNGDMGSMIADWLMAQTANLNIAMLTHDDFYCQYPCTAIDLFKTYREGNENDLFTRIKELEAQTGGKIGENTLNQLADMCANRDVQVSKHLAEENVRLFPQNAEAAYLLGEINLYNKDYKAGYKYLKKAKELRYSGEPTIDYDIKVCAEKMESQ